MRLAVNFEANSSIFQNAAVWLRPARARKKIIKSRCRAVFGFCLVGAIAILPAGCSDKNIGHIHGKVTLNGQPLTQGSVLFEDMAANISIFVSLSPEGTYKIRTHDQGGLPAGTYHVAIIPDQSGGSGIPTPMMTQPGRRASGSNSPIPMKYQNAATSGLTATVRAGDNPPFDFELVQ